MPVKNSSSIQFCKYRSRESYLKCVFKQIFASLFSLVFLELLVLKASYSHMASSEWNVKTGTSTRTDAFEVVKF